MHRHRRPPAHSPSWGSGSAQRCATGLLHCAPHTHWRSNYPMRMIQRQTQPAWCSLGIPAFLRICRGARLHMHAYRRGNLAIVLEFFQRQAVSIAISGRAALPFVTAWPQALPIGSLCFTWAPKRRGSRRWPPRSPQPSVPTPSRAAGVAAPVAAARHPWSGLLRAGRSPCLRARSVPRRD